MTATGSSTHADNQGVHRHADFDRVGWVVLDLDDEPPLFYLEEPRFGCTQPVRRGDLVRIKRLFHGWPHEGKLCVVVDVCLEGECIDELGAPDWDILSDPSECKVILDGILQTCRIEYLEAI